MRRVLWILAVAVFGAALAMLLAVVVLLGTNRGARQVLSWMPGGQLTARGVRGALRSPLELDDVEYRTKTLSITIGHLVVHWKLAGIVRRSLDVGLVRAERVRIRPIGPAPPPTAPGPLPDIRLPLDVRVRELHVRDFRWEGRDGGGFALDEVRGALAWRDSALHVTSLAARAPTFDVTLDGRVTPRGDYPLDLTAAGAYTPPGRATLRGRAQAAGSLARSRVALRLLAPCTARADAVLRDLVRTPSFDGTLAFDGLDPRTLAPGAPAMRLTGRLAARGTLDRCAGEGHIGIRAGPYGDQDAEFALARSGDSLRIDRLAVTAPGQPLRVEADGIVTGLGGAPSVNARLAWQRFRWPLAGRDTVFFCRQGAGRVNGSVANWAVQLESDFAVPAFDLGHWRLTGRGDTTRVRVDRFDVRMAEGTAHGRGRFDWKPYPTWSAVVNSDSLDPGRRWPGLDGRLVLDARTTGSVRRETAAWDVQIDRLDGSLHALAFAARGAVSGRATAWRLDAVQAGWGGAQIAADGGADRDWALAGSIAAPSIAPFLPEASGSLHGRFGITGALAAPRFHAEGSADSLVVTQSSARTLRFSGEFGTRDRDPLALMVDAREATVGPLAFDTLSVRGEGSAAQHTLRASGRGPGTSVDAEVAGGRAGDAWRGRLERLALTTRASGDWRLEYPVGAELSARAARIDSFCFRSGNAGVCGVFGWRTGGALHAGARIDDLPLALGEPWLPEGARVAGSISGTIAAHADGGAGPLVADVRLRTTPVEIAIANSAQRSDTLRLSPGTITATSGAGGTQAALAIGWGDGNTVDAELSAPGFDPLRPDTTRPLTGYVRIDAADLGGFAVFVPGLDRVAGRLQGDVQLGGTVLRPKMAGEVRLHDGSAAFPALGVALEDATFTLHAAADSSAVLSGSVRSGKGTLTVRGRASLAQAGRPTAALHVQGQNVQAAQTREADVRVSPDIEIKLDGTRLDVTGQLEVPFARLVTSNKMNLPVPRSPDVVLVGNGRDTTHTALAIHSRVRVVIGDDVEVRVPNFTGRPEGSILAIDEPGQATLASGELEVKDGTYRAYGQDLKIDHGKLVFGGGPIANPGLDLRATRTADDGTIAGVDISGTAEAPIVRLFTNPAKSENDAVSYIMFGKPASESNAGSQAASQLGVEGTDMLARGVASRLGIQGASVESKEGSLQDAALFLGTYVSPKLYVSYGVGLFESSSTLRVRYKMNKRWAVQTESGSSRSGLLQYTGER